MNRKKPTPSIWGGLWVIPMPRFAILEHDWPGTHLDFLLECDGVLKAWRFPSDTIPSIPTAATSNVDHRSHYLDYEGPVPGDRGSVTRRDGGELEWLECRPEAMRFRLGGTIWHGEFELIRIDETTWQLTARNRGSSRKSSTDPLPSSAIPVSCPVAIG